MNSQAACKWIRRASTAAALTYTAVAEYQLARRLGAAPPIAVMLPVAIDCYVIAALKWFRAFDVALSLSLMGAAQVAAHALDAGVLNVTLQLVAVVSLLAPIALWRTHALARGEAQDTSAAPEILDVIQEVPAAKVDLERVPEVYPAIEAAVPAVPEAVPAGVRLLPIVARPEPVLDVIQGAAVPAAEYARTRPEVHAEYVPEPDDGDGYGVPAPPVEDELTAKVRGDWPQTIEAGMAPTIRQLRERYGIGQARAQRIRDELSGATS
ncbi:hypothetical protein [Streptomyces sp. NBC_00212]|uniref:hypothetical protein n=1 Tax=Streptomyces sp. NBC_00212 TaxID=2975684 RepID=UPI00324CFF0B